MLTQFHCSVKTEGRGLINITNQVADFLAALNLTECGLCHIFIHHTSASLVIAENADPLVQRDMEAFMTRLIPDGDPIYQHTDEGPDDMPSHIRSILTTSCLTIPITQGKLALGRWQGIYLWEHRFRAYERKLTISVVT